MPIFATTRSKVIGLLAGGFAVLIANTLFSLWVDERTSTFTDLVTSDQNIKASLASLLIAAKASESAHRGYLLTGETKYLQPYWSARRALPRHIASLEKMSHHDLPLTQVFPEIKSLTSQLEKLITLSIDLGEDGARQRAIEQFNWDREHEVMRKLRSAVDILSNKQDTFIREGSTQLKNYQSLSLYANFAALVLILLVAGTTGTIVFRFVDQLNATQFELRTVNQGLEKIVEERTNDIVRANEEIQRFAYIVSHDLRAPLVNIMGFTSELEAIGKTVRRQYDTLVERAPDLLQNDTREAVKDELPEAIGFIRSSTAKMDRLINAILKLSREGRRELAPVHVNMTDLVTQVSASIRHQIDEADGEIIIEKLPPLETDQLAIDQIFSNVIENAVKYIDPSRPPRIEITGYAEGLQVHYTIADNGRGIETKDLERVFELFRRAGRQTVPGEGLGLAFVRAAVRRLGGGIAIESEPGVGTTLKLRFPKKLTTRNSRRTANG